MGVGDKFKNVMEALPINVKILLWDRLVDRVKSDPNIRIVDAGQLKLNAVYADTSEHIKKYLEKYNVTKLEHLPDEIQKKLDHKLDKHLAKEWGHVIMDYFNGDVK
jgi:hypothetical protein